MALAKAGKVQTLVSGAVVPWDLGLGANAVLTLTMNATLAAPSHMVPGVEYTLKVVQDTVGGWTLTFDAAYEFPGGVDPVITATADAIDVLTFWSDGTDMFLKDIQQDLL